MSIKPKLKQAMKTFMWAVGQIGMAMITLAGMIVGLINVLIKQRL